MSRQMCPVRQENIDLNKIGSLESRAWIVYGRAARSGDPMFQLFQKNKFKPRPKQEEPEGIALEIAETAKFLARLRIIDGSDNQIIVGEGSVVRGDIRIQGRGNRIIIGRDVAIGGRIVIKGRNQSIEIGDGTAARDTYILCQEGQSVKIGRNCLFSRRVEIRTTDAHALVSRTTGERLNLPASVSIGDHVWIGVDVLVSKGATIAEDNVVGAKSFVSGTFTESGTVIAGVPARVLKRDITWQRDRKKAYDISDLDNWRA